MTIPTHYEALAEYLDHHVRAEEDALAAYRDAIDGRPDDVASYLIEMILADEERHHAMFRELQNSLESSIHWSDIEPKVPSIRLEGGDAATLLETTGKLLEAEQQDARELKALRKKWSHPPGERPLWALLVETVELDTNKHIRLLKFLRNLLGDALD